MGFQQWLLDEIFVKKNRRNNYIFIIIFVIFLTYLVVLSANCFEGNSDRHRFTGTFEKWAPARYNAKKFNNIVKVLFTIRISSRKLSCKKVVNIACNNLKKYFRAKTWAKGLRMFVKSVPSWMFRWCMNCAHKGDLSGDLEGKGSLTDVFWEVRRIDENPFFWHSSWWQNCLSLILGFVVTAVIWRGRLFGSWRLSKFTPRF